MSDQKFQAYAEWTRPANTTAYAAGDVVGINLTITGASNATPIVITSASHGLATGDMVTIASVGGNTAANGTWKITKVGDNTFSLDGSVGNAAYTSGGTVAKWHRLAGVGRVNGKGVIDCVQLEKSTNASSNAQFSILFMRTNESDGKAPAAFLDNAALGGLHSNRANIVGETPTMTFATVGYDTDQGALVGATNLGIHFSLVGRGSDLYAAPIAKAAYTPGSAEVFRIIASGTKD